MKKSLLLFFAVLTTFLCHAQTPEEIVNDVYKSASESNFEKIARYILPDSIAPLSKEEEKTFAGFARQSAGEYVSFSVDSVSVNPAGTEATFTVTTNFTDGRSFTETGTLRKSKQGRWRLMADADTTDLVEPYSVSSQFYMTPELMRNLYYASVMTLAARKIPQYQNLAGNILSEGILTAMDDAGALRLFSAAADKGYVPAYRNLASVYVNRDGVAKDYGKAFDYSMKGAALGDAISMANVGQIYMEPEYPDNDPVKAKEWFEKAAAAGSSRGFLGLAVMYINGAGVDTDYTKATEYLTKALEVMKYHDNTGDCERILGMVYLYGLGTEPNPDKAEELLKKATARGSYDAFSALTDLYLNSGQYDKWFPCLVEFEKMGKTRSYFLLYVAYINGWGTDRNTLKAIEYLIKGAEADDGDAMDALAKHYFNGAGVPMNLNEAKVWAEKAGEAGIANGYALLGYIYSMDGIEQDYEKAFTAFQKAADIGTNDGEGEMNFGVCYLNGWGTDRNPEEANGLR